MVGEGREVLACGLRLRCARMSVAVAIISIVSFFIGQALVTKRCCFGFLVWAVSNLMVAVLNFSTGDHATGCMFTVYFLTNGYSLFAWAKESVE